MSCVYHYHRKKKLHKKELPLYQIAKAKIVNSKWNCLSNHGGYPSNIILKNGFS